MGPDDDQPIPTPCSIPWLARIVGKSRQATLSRNLSLCAEAPGQPPKLSAVRQLVAS